MSFIEKWLGLILSALSLLVSVFTIIFSSVTLITWIFTAILLIYIVVEICFCIIKKRKEPCLSFNKEIVDNFFDTSAILYTLENRLDQNLPFHKKKNLIENDLIEVLDKFCDSIYRYTKQRYSASIKIIENDSSIFSIMDKKIITICRSKNSSFKRRNLDKQPTTARENTCYKVILEDNQQNHFICEDLSMLPQNGQTTTYLNHNPNYLEHYKSIIVVPIATENAYNEANINAHNIIYGFMTVDSKNKSNEKNIDIIYETAIRHTPLIVEYIKAYNNITGGYISEIFK